MNQHLERQINDKIRGLELEVSITPNWVMHLNHFGKNNFKKQAFERKIKIVDDVINIISKEFKDIFYVYQISKKESPMVETTLSGEFSFTLATMEVQLKGLQS